MPTKQKKSVEKKEVDYGLKITGTVRVFAKDRVIPAKKKGEKNYTITDHWFNVSRKDDAGNYENKSVKLLFQKDLEVPENNCLITISDSFFVLNGSGEYAKAAILVMEYDYADEE